MANKDKGGTKGDKKQAKKSLKEKRASKKAKKLGGGSTMPQALRAFEFESKSAQDYATP